MNPTRPTLAIAAAAVFAAGAISSTFAGDSGEGLVIKPSPALAEECLSYDFFDLQYIYTRFDSLENGHGVGANFSKGIAGNVYFTASGSWSSSSIDDADVDLYGASAGLGYAIPMSTRFHLNIEAGGLYGGYDGPDGADEEWGAYVGPGFRYCLSPGTELFANVYYLIYEESEDLFETNVGLVANITDTVAFKIAGLLNKDDRSVLVGLRFYY